MLDALMAKGAPDPVQPLPVTFEACYGARDLPAVDRDRLDRMIAAQARRRAVPVVSADPVFDAYGCERVL